MHRVFIALSCVIFIIGGINAASLGLRKSIDNDTIVLVSLIEKTWSLKPAVLLNYKPLIYCQVIDQCCGDKDRAQAISLYFRSTTENYAKHQFDEALSACKNSTAQDQGNQLCRTSDQSADLPELDRSDLDVQQYMKVVEKHVEKFNNLMDNIDVVCTDEEMHALLCLSDRKLIETCVGKVLREIIKRSSYRTYNKFIRISKQVFTKINQELSG